MNPTGNVTSQADGNLYGTTSQGGTNDSGVVFKLLPPQSEGGAWTESVLHDFEGRDGSRPVGGLIFGEHGVLFGVTAAGGTNNRGTVFAVDK